MSALENDTPTGVKLTDLADLVRAAHEWGAQEASYFYGRKNHRRRSRQALVWWWAQINMMTHDHAEHDLAERLKDIWQGS